MSLLRSARKFYDRGIVQYLRSHWNLSVLGNGYTKLKEWRALVDQVRAAQPGNIAARGFKVYSQNDEDGIIAALFETIGGGRTFIEIGVQTGQECNSHYLLLNGWRGAWIEASAKSCAAIRKTLGAASFPGRLELVEDFVTVANAGRHYRSLCEALQVEEVDFYSLDIDGNDLYVLRALLESGARPAAFCVEYNGKFPPPLAISVTLDESRGWASDDYLGASLQAFCDVFAEYGYRLVTCSVVGVNAFFVRGDHAGKFPEYAPADLWHPARVYLARLPAPFPDTMKWLVDRLNAGS